MLIGQWTSHDIRPHTVTRLNFHSFHFSRKFQYIHYFMLFLFEQFLWRRYRRTRPATAVQPPSSAPSTVCSVGREPPSSSPRHAGDSSSEGNSIGEKIAKSKDQSARTYPSAVATKVARTALSPTTKKRSLSWQKKAGTNRRVTTMSRLQVGGGVPLTINMDQDTQL